MYCVMFIWCFFLILMFCLFDHKDNDTEIGGGGICFRKEDLYIIIKISYED